MENLCSREKKIFSRKSYCSSRRRQWGNLKRAEAWKIEKGTRSNWVFWYDFESLKETRLWLEEMEQVSGAAARFVLDFISLKFAAKKFPLLGYSMWKINKSHLWVRKERMRKLLPSAQRRWSAIKKSWILHEAAENQISLKDFARRFAEKIELEHISFTIFAPKAFCMNKK